MKIQVPIIKGDKIGSETDYRDALPVNMYAVGREILGAAGYLLDYPGLVSFATGLGIDRGANYNERFGNQYRLSGTSLVSVSSTGTVASLGTISGGSQATMIDLYSFNTQGIIADGNFFLYDTTNGLVQVTDADLGNPIDGVWVDGYYFLTDGEYIYHTDLADETSIDPLKFATAEFMPDPSNGISKTQDNKVMVWGRYSLEFFVNTANDNFAFTRVETRAQKIGIVATHAKCESSGKFYITGGYRDSAVGVYLVGVGTSEKVSTREIDKILSQYSEPELSDMRMEARTENNTTYIIVHLPGETLCFNESISKTFGKMDWTILKTGVKDEPYRGINGVFDARNAKWIYGDKLNTNIGELDNDVRTQYGEIAEGIFYSPLVDLEQYSIDKISLETIPGHTTALDATVAISLTYDGVIYGQEEWELYGNPSDYNQRFILRRLGICNDWIGFKFRTASTSRMAFAMFEVEYG